jgi:hypothetical protein
VRAHAGGIADALVVDPRLPNRHRTRRRDHLPFGVVAVAHHQPPAMLIDLVGERLDIGDDLGLQRGRKHLPRPNTHDFIGPRERAAPPGDGRGIFTGNLDEIERDIRAVHSIGATELFFDPIYSADSRSEDGFFGHLERIPRLVQRATGGLARTA